MTKTQKRKVNRTNDLWDKWEKTRQLWEKLSYVWIDCLKSYPRTARITATQGKPRIWNICPIVFHFSKFFPLVTAPVLVNVGELISSLRRLRFVNERYRSQERQSGYQLSSPKKWETQQQGKSNWLIELPVRSNFSSTVHCVWIEMRWSLPNKFFWGFNWFSHNFSGFKYANAGTTKIKTKKREGWQTQQATKAMTETRANCGIHK